MFRDSPLGLDDVLDRLTRPYRCAGGYRADCPVCNQPGSLLIKQKFIEFEYECCNSCLPELIQQVIEHRMPFELAPAKPTQLSAVKPESVEWIWPGWIPAGKLTVISGEPGTFKSGIAISIAARLSTGRPMPIQDSTPHSSFSSKEAVGLVRDAETERERPSVNSLLVLGEDDLADTVRPRLDVTHADVSRIFAYSFDGLPARIDFDAMEKHIRESDVKFVVVDPLSAFVKPNAGGGVGASIHGLLSSLKILARNTGAAIVVVGNLPRGVGANAARSLILCTRLPSSEAGFVFTSVKNNLSSRPSGLVYHIETGFLKPYCRWNPPPPEDGSAKVVWDGVYEPAASIPSRGRPQAAGAPKTKLVEATEFLLRELCAGPARTSDIERRAVENEIAEITLRRARLGITEKKRCNEDSHGGGYWMMSLTAEGVKAAKAIHLPTRPLDDQIDRIGLNDRLALVPYVDIDPRVDHAGAPEHIDSKPDAGMDDRLDRLAPDERLASSPSINADERFDDVAPPEQLASNPDADIDERPGDIPNQSICANVCADHRNQVSPGRVEPAGGGVDIDNNPTRISTDQDSSLRVRRRAKDSPIPQPKRE